MVLCLPRLADTGSRPTQLFGFRQRIGVATHATFSVSMNQAQRRSATPSYYNDDSQSSLSLAWRYKPSASALGKSMSEPRAVATGSRLNMADDPPRYRSGY